MKSYTNTLKILVLVAALAGFLLSTQAEAAASNAVKLLTVEFEPRDVVQVEVGDFHFAPGQVAPVHTHVAPTVGYVVKGEIIYQIEGERQQLLREGDVFYEPTGPRILRLDNASATEKAIFVDFNLQQTDEPFIVFEQPPTESIDRRSLPTVDIVNRQVGQVEIYANDLALSESIALDTGVALLGLVAEGIVELQVNDDVKQRIAAGQSFSVPKSASNVSASNTSAEVPARIITFHLR